MKNVYITGINTMTLPEADIKDCLAECLQLSYEKNTEVILTNHYNDKTFTIDTNFILDEIIDQGREKND